MLMDFIDISSLDISCFILILIILFLFSEIGDNEMTKL